MTEFERLERKAEKKGWAGPRGSTTFSDATWIRYWRACEEYAQAKHRGEDDPGKPFPPHRSGGARLI